MDLMETDDSWPRDHDGRLMAACPCGQPMGGHHHWDGYWTWRGRQQLIEAMFPEVHTRA